MEDVWNLMLDREGVTHLVSDERPGALCGRKGVTVRQVGITPASSANCERCRAAAEEALR